MPCVPHIYCFPGFPTLPRKNATFWKLVHAVLAEIHDSVSLYFDQDCLQKQKMLILSKMGHDWNIWDPFSKKNMLIPSFDVTIRRLFGIVTM